MRFACEHSEEACRQIIDSYVRCGGDKGVTEKYIREACGLPTFDDSRTKAGAGHLLSNSQDAAADVRETALDALYAY